MAKRFIHIRGHSRTSPEEIIGPIPDGVSPHVLVERWQREDFYALMTGKPSPCTWRIIEAGNLVDALVGSERLKAEV